MPKFCHGNGNLDSDGCCYVAGQVCPLRLKIVNGRVLEGPALTDVGNVQSYTRSLGNKQVSDRAAAQLEGVTYACGAALRVIAADGSLLTNRAGFEAAWAARAEYQPIADEWEVIGKPRNWCQQYGPAESACCYAEDETTNASKRQNLNAQAVQIRRGRSV